MPSDIIDRIEAGLSHSACLINGICYLWGLWSMRQEMIFKKPTKIKDKLKFGETVQDI
jgi:hypothetical protein